MSNAAAIKFAGYFLEWQLIEDGKAELAERSKDLFKAMKGEDFDTKAARATFRDKRIELTATSEDVAKAEEAEAILDMYRAALDEGLTARARSASARVENIEEFPPRDGVYTHEVCFDAETGEIHPDPRSSEVDGGQPSPSPEAMTAQKAAVGSPAAGQEPFGADITVHSGQESASAAQGGNEPASASGASATHSDDFTPPAFLNKKASPLRPHCLNPGDQCAGYGSKHCHACLKAVERESEAA